MTYPWHSPFPLRADGRPRRIGVELEFGGLTLDVAANLVSQWSGRPVDLLSRAEAEVGSVWGPVRIEVDWHYLKRIAVEAKLAPENANKERWLELLEQLAKVATPMEVVLPPIPLRDMPRVEPLIQALKLAGAEGTDSSLLAAYGLHLNVELPQLNAGWLLAYIQSFGLLQWWLAKRYRVDITRRISPFIEFWPEAYVHASLTYPDGIDFDGLCASYYAHNPSRNRALDLWPIFAEVNSSFVDDTLDNNLIQARPALHFRMPNCDLGMSGWQLQHSWTPFRVVELLIEDADGRAELAAAFSRRQSGRISAGRGFWVDHLDKWLLRYPGALAPQ